MWQLAPGARLDITRPASLVAVDWARENYCLIAGGIGITPILGAAQALARRGADVTLHYAVRGRADAAYLDDLSSRSVTAWPSMPAMKANASISTRCSPRCPRAR